MKLVLRPSFRTARATHQNLSPKKTKQPNKKGVNVLKVRGYILNAIFHS